MTYILAEAGVNHNGDINLALELVDIAVETGANAIKFQSFKSENLASKDAKKADYQKENMNSNNDSQLEMLKKLELSEDDFKLIYNRCIEKNIEFICTPFDLDSVDYLDNLVNIFKVASSDITNKPLLIRIGEKQKKILYLLEVLQ